MDCVELQGALAPSSGRTFYSKKKIDFTPTKKA